MAASFVAGAVSSYVAVKMAAKKARVNGELIYVPTGRHSSDIAADVFLDYTQVRCL
jgi:hypothetical protein